MAVKQANMSDKKKPIAVISPQKKEKSFKNSKWDRTSKDAHNRSSADSEIKHYYVYFLSVMFMAVGFAFLHMYHVSSMFENDRHFSHLSNLEREMTFRTEMGLYYSYYKTLIEAPTFTDGMYKILEDNVTEYPSVINTLKRFNLYPEVMIGAAFRMYTYLMSLLEIPAKQCWQVERGGGLKPVLSCEGLGDPMYFYLQAVWLCAGVTAAVVFFYGTFLSESVYGGLISIACFFFNHGESTRVQWTPPLRESFAYPALLLQMLSVSVLLRSGCSRWKQGFGVSIATVMCLTSWQFSQFVLATQLMVLLALFSIGGLSKRSLLVILVVVAVGVQHALLLLLGNELLASSFLVALILGAVFTALLLEPALKLLPLPLPPFWFTLTLPLSTAAAFFFRLKLLEFFSTSDDAHILNLLRSKLGSYKDFHTLLYTCSAEFDFLPFEYVRKLSETLLLPSVLVGLFGVLVHGICSLCQSTNKQKNEKNRRENLNDATETSIQFVGFDVEPELFYNIGQTVVFAVMAALVMRLKLLLTPHLCILASLLASRKYFSVIDSKSKHWALLAVLLSAMSYRGLVNIREQRSIIGEYSNVGLEQLLEWVKTETPPDAVFAGPMPVMANLLLSTRRPIVNHPHYEDAGLRERTKKVYSVFSRRSPQEAYKILSQMQVQFLVLEESWCFRESKPGCSMTDIWDVEEPELRQQPALCPRLFLQNPAPFERVFSNNEYVVLWLHSQYVELQPRREYKL